MCNVQQAEAAPRPGPSVCRSLFGPVDHAELSRELHSRLREMEEESSRRWDFDFQRGVPLRSSRYAWEETREDTVPGFYRAPLRVRVTTPESTGDTQHASRSDTQRASRSDTQRASRSDTQHASRSDSHRCQAASSTPSLPPPASSASSSPQPPPTASTELNNNGQPVPSASPDPSKPQPALHASSGPCKRSLPVSHITGFFPVKKKSKVVKALCDTLHSRSPILTEHTPRKMLR